MSLPVRAPVNALTVDVEDWFQVSAFEGHVERGDWDRLPSRVEGNTDAILELFAARGARATFFCLGWVAERFPALLRRVHAAGHEVASHGYDHVRITEQSPEALAEDAGHTKRLLEDTIGAPVRGYRAASFSIGRDNLWALDVLGELGYEYSSSIYPVRHDLYGMPEAPRHAFRHRTNGILEVPMTTLEILGRNLPCAGGGFFRLLPYAYFRWAIRRVNAESGRAAIFYFHPWEIDPGQPRQGGLGLKTRFRHYVNLARTRPRLERLLADFTWDRMDRLFLDDPHEVAIQPVRSVVAEGG
jgi:polysaccharide deacetylase family protein (PEP-CTERM system associated)